MKSISAKTGELLRGLNARKNPLDKIFGASPPPLRAFEALGESGEVLAVPHFANFLLHQNKEVREAAAKAVNQLMAGLTGSDYVEFDEAARTAWEYDAASPWRNQSSSLARLKQLPEPLRLLGLASFHNNGYIREAAVAELSKLAEGAEIPFLLLRINDWIGVVRQKATAAIAARLKPECAHHLFNNLPLVLRLKTCGRERHEEIVNGVLGLLRESHAATLLKKGMTSNDRWMRRESFRLAMESKSFESTELFKNLLKEKDPIQRLWAVRNVLGRLPEAELREVLPVMVHDPFMGVRCKALALYAERFPVESQDALRQALLDTHSSMRSLARYFLKEQKVEIDPASFYRQAVKSKSGRQLSGAILGLGETGTPEDGPLLLSFLTHPIVRVHRAVLSSLATLQGDKYVDQFVVALADKHPGVSNEGTKALTSRMGLVDAEFIWGFTQKDHLAHVRKNAFKLITFLPMWRRGKYIIQALGDKDAIVAKMAATACQDWLIQTRSMSFPPSAKELADIRAAIELNKTNLSEYNQNELKFWLKGYL
jgi:HEAT repeat protein